MWQLRNFMCIKHVFILVDHKEHEYLYGTPIQPLSLVSNAIFNPPLSNSRDPEPGSKPISASATIDNLGNSFWFLIHQLRTFLPHTSFLHLTTQHHTWLLFGLFFWYHSHCAMLLGL